MFTVRVVALVEALIPLHTLEDIHHVHECLDAMSDDDLAAIERGSTEAQARDWRGRTVERFSIDVFGLCAAARAPPLRRALGLGRQR
jgi:hypothetical protein